MQQRGTNEETAASVTVTVLPTDTLLCALRVMEQHQVRLLPVVEEAGRAAGADQRGADSRSLGSGPPAAGLRSHGGVWPSLGRRGGADGVVPGGRAGLAAAGLRQLRRRERLRYSARACRTPQAVGPSTCCAAAMGRCTPAPPTTWSAGSPRTGGARGAAYTRARLPVKLVWSEPAEDRGAALRREAALKRLTRAEKLRLIGRPAGLTVGAWTCSSAAAAVATRWRSGCSGRC